MTITLRPYTAQDRALLEALNSPAMTAHLGGPESAEKITDRLRRYIDEPGMFVVERDGETAGNIGYWPREWRGRQVWEAGWGVLPGHQGHGVARAALGMLLDRVPGEVHAFPSVDNAPSNALCRSAGFELLGEVEFEYPPGHLMACHDWYRPG